MFLVWSNYSQFETENRWKSSGRKWPRIGDRWSAQCFVRDYIKPSKYSSYIFLSIFQHDFGDFLKATNVPMCHGVFAIAFNRMQDWRLGCECQCDIYILRSDIILHFARVFAQIGLLYTFHHQNGGRAFAILRCIGFGKIFGSNFGFRFQHFAIFPPGNTAWDGRIIFTMQFSMIANFCI